MQKTENNQTEQNKMYMIQAVNEICSSTTGYIEDCLDPGKIGTDYHKEAEAMTLEEAIKDLDVYYQDFLRCGINKGDAEVKYGKVEPIFLIDLVIAAGIVFQKTEQKQK